VVSTKSMPEGTGGTFSIVSYSTGVKVTGVSMLEAEGWDVKKSLTVYIITPIGKRKKGIENEVKDSSFA
jgi:hypothetical protein